MISGFSERLRPQYLVRDRSVLTGNAQRIAERFGIDVVDPVSGRPFQVTVFRYRAGSGARQVLAVHGFRGDHHGLELLVDGLTGVDVWVPDLPGFGASPAMPDAEHTVDHLSHVVNQIAQHLQTPTILGHSFGSVIAAYAVAQRSVRYRQLMLLNPIVKPALAAQTPVDWAATRVTDGFYRLCAALPLGWGRKLLANRVIIWATGAFMTKTDDPRVLAYTHDQHQAYFSAFDSPEALFEAYRASIERTVSDVADALTLPTTLIGGAQDELCPPEDVDALSQMLATANRDVESYVLQRTGHLLHYERSAAAAALVSWRL